MTRKLKQPDGWLCEEYITESAHLFEGGELQGHDNDASRGYYTGRFRFDYSPERSTRWYTVKTAPKWLLAYYQDALRGK